MRAELRGNSGSRVLAVIGAWDPLSALHLSLFKQLTEDAHLKGLQACVVIIYPPPTHLLLLSNQRALEYDDLEGRLALIETCGIDCIVTVYFEVADLDRTAEEFIRLVMEHVDLRHLLLGATQSLGRGSRGSQSTIAEIAAQMGFGFGLMPLHKDAINTRAVWDYLAVGNIYQAARLVGHSPIRVRPPHGWIDFKWPAGHYPVVPLRNPADVFSLPQVDPIIVELSEMGSARRMCWPSHNIECIAFVGNPNIQSQRGRSGQN